MSTLSSSSSSPSSSSSSSSTTSPLSIRHVASDARGHSDHGWLNTYHTFSFAGYYNPSMSSLHSLRVLNEDRVAGGQGFPRHPHRFYEIFSYVVKGALLHQDSMGHKQIIKTGEVQFTSAGTGISHSEYNASSNRSDYVHFLQIWVAPSQSDLTPHYQTRSFTDEQKYGKLCLIVSPAERDTNDNDNDTNKYLDTVKIHQDMKVYASMLKHDEEVSIDLLPGRAMYVHLIQDSTGYSSERGSSELFVNGVKLNEGDGACIELKAGATDKQIITLRALNNNNDGRRAHFLLFDMINSKNNKNNNHGDDDDDDQ